MSIAETVLPEFDNEMASTRKLLERAPEAHASWKPHPKSYSLGDLVTHVANLPVWATITLKDSELHLNPPGGPKFTPLTYAGAETTLKNFDSNVATARETIAATDDAAFMAPWTLKNAGATVFTLPRVVVLRSFVLNHLIHHRGQLSVYLRLKDVPLPSIYGPTADDPAGM